MIRVVMGLLDAKQVSKEGEAGNDRRDGKYQERRQHDHRNFVRMIRLLRPAFADEDGDEHGYEYGGEGGESAVEEVHEVLANLMLLLIAVHVGGVVLTSFRHSENLARSMVTGDKRAPEPGDIS